MMNREVSIRRYFRSTTYLMAFHVLNIFILIIEFSLDEAVKIPFLRQLAFCTSFYLIPLWMGLIVTDIFLVSRYHAKIGKGTLAFRLCVFGLFIWLPLHYIGQVIAD